MVSLLSLRSNKDVFTAPRHIYMSFDTRIDFRRSALSNQLIWIGIVVPEWRFSAFIRDTKLMSPGYTLVQFLKTHGERFPLSSSWRAISSNPFIKWLVGKLKWLRSWKNRSYVYNKPFLVRLDKGSGLMLPPRSSYWRTKSVSSGKLFRGSSSKLYRRVLIISWKRFKNFVIVQYSWSEWPFTRHDRASAFQQNCKVGYFLIGE